MTPEEFENCFDRFQASAFRLECLQAYDVDEEHEEIAAWRRGLPRPEYSVRTDPWLRRIAMTTVAGKSWQRARVVRHPLSEYLHWELLGYVESQAVGEQIGLIDQADHPELTQLPDFWLFDAGTAEAFGVQMHYDSTGRFVSAELVTDPATLDAWTATARSVWAEAVPLNRFLATLAHPCRAIG
jgi:hypothetical protein